MGELNGVIHQPARLRIMAALNAVSRGRQIEFSGLGKMLELTDGNLGSHLQTLETAGYIQIEKTFVDRKPKTLVSATAKGRNEFAEHVAALQEIIAGAKRPRGE
ncbi:MAG TPA: transcriptional regulator [Chthoniobacteraceae bacterium]|jgi:DNA-binding MarR family transcriptional regulator